jgi:hypothetical protein
MLFPALSCIFSVATVTGFIAQEIMLADVVVNSLYISCPKAGTTSLS